MDVRKLRYFVAVAEEHSISRAATRLHMSQPPLTRHIRSLEEELGVTLFTRTNWGVELTQAGISLLSHAHGIRTHIDQVTEEIRHADQAPASRLDIGIFGSAMLGAIPPILQQFSASHPEIQVVLHNGPASVQVDALRQGRILAAFERNLPEMPGIQVRLVCRESLLVAVNRHHPLARQTAVHATELGHEPMIGEQTPCILAAAQAMFRHYGMTPHIVQRAADMISATILVSAGFGCALVPQSLENMPLRDVVYLPLISEVQPQVDLQCAFPRGNALPQLRTLLAVIDDLSPAACMEPAGDTPAYGHAD